MLASAISACSDVDLDYARTLSRNNRVLCSPNITLGINFLITAAKLLRKIAETLEVDSERITSLRPPRSDLRLPASDHAPDPPARPSAPALRLR